MTGSNADHKPHVLVINVYFAPYTYGGATIVAEQVVQALRQHHACEITVISAMSRADLAPYAVIKSARDGIMNYLINIPFQRPYQAIYNNPQVTERLLQLMRHIEPDLVHLHCLQDLGSGAIVVARQLGLPVILSTHDFWWICERQFMIRTDGAACFQNPVEVKACAGCVENLDLAEVRQAHLRAQVAQVDLLTCPSRFALELSIRSGLQGQVNRVWQNGVHLPQADFTAKQMARRGRDPGRLAFGFVGGPSQIKGWPLIRQAFALMRRQGGAVPDFDVYLVEGSLDGSWWRGHDFSDLAGTWHVVPRFAQAEMDRFYERIDVLLFLSQWRETFGLTIREALARGIRVIQTDSGGTVEHVMADQASLLPIGAGPEVLCGELERVLATPQAHPAPVAVRSFADQAAELHGWIVDLV
jgi:glycosyltransferase involved in cell wall biosynthesis